MTETRQNKATDAAHYASGCRKPPLGTRFSHGPAGRFGKTKPTGGWGGLGGTKPSVHGHRKREGGTVVAGKIFKIP
jgi:hypothetical protein